MFIPRNTGCDDQSLFVFFLFLFFVLLVFLFLLLFLQNPSSFLTLYDVLRIFSCFKCIHKSIHKFSRLKVFLSSFVRSLFHSSIMAKLVLGRVTIQNCFLRSLIFSTVQCLVSNKKSHVLKHTCNWKLLVC